MTPSFELDAADYFTAGTVGPPGERVFYLQGREAKTVVTLKVEKEQVRALAEYLAGLLVKLRVPEETLPSDLPLLEPIAPAWAVASLGVGYDEARDRIVVVASAVKEGAEDEESAPEPQAAERQDALEEEEEDARFVITRAQAAAFVERARALVRAGRATCSMCGTAMDPGGHVCPRANGHAGTAPP